MAFNVNQTRIRSMNTSIKEFVNKKRNELVEESSCRSYLAPYIINPTSRWKVIWDIQMGLWYLLAYIIDPLVLAFFFKPLEYKAINNFQKNPKSAQPGSRRGRRQWAGALESYKRLS